jgi:acyl-coenzyme A synthetase/AMP-(fatty) acid ligase
MLTVLAQGVRIIMYEGSPLYPDVKKFLRFIDEQKYSYPNQECCISSCLSHSVNVFVTMPRFLLALQTRGILPRRKSDAVVPFIWRLNVQ